MEIDLVNIITSYSPESRITKPWGYEVILFSTKEYTTKLIYIEKSHRLSLQYHEKKKETIVPLSCSMFIDFGSKEEIKKIKILQGQSFTINPGDYHRFCAHDDMSVLLLETSFGYQDDILRIEDDYGR